MEEKSFRRPAIKESATKRPRVVEGGKRKGGSNGDGVAANRDCSVPPFRPPSGSGQPVGPKPEAGTKEASQKQETTNHQQHRREEEGVEELVAKYRSALADLTFNSKPMITNLSIIAGENLHAAKEIAEIICDNILAVRSEYKLPSLYLLDSITKNIGGDYVDYFAAKLPEVFCKAYKLVDSSIIPSMRHLFETWEKHFPAAPLQTIEKELGFPPTVKDSSRSTVAKPDSQSRDHPQGILVNPKFLEGRQHIHHSSRVKETASEDTKRLITPVCDAMRPDRTAVTGRLRPLMDLPLVKANSQNPLRVQLSVPVHEKKGHGGPEFSSDLAQQSELEVGTLSGRDNEQCGLGKQWYVAGGTAAETPVGRSNGFGSNHAYGDYRVLGSTQSDHHLPSVCLNNATKTSQLSSDDWKNSEEEEFMWDDVSFKLTDCGGVIIKMKDSGNASDADKSAGLQRGKWKPSEIKHLDAQWHQLSPFPPTEFDQRFVQQYNQQDTASRLNIEISVHSKSTKRAALVQHASMASWPMYESSPSMASLDQKSSRNSGLLEGQPTCLSGGSSTVTNSSLPPPVGGLPGTAVPTSFGPPITTKNIHPGFGRSRRQQPLRTSPPSAHLLPCGPQHQKLDIPTDHGRVQPLSQTPQRPMQLPGQQFDQQHRPLAPGGYYYSSVLPQNNNNAQQDAATSQNLPLLHYYSSQPPQQLLQNSSASFLTQWRHCCYPLLQQQQQQSRTDPSLLQQQPHSQPPQFIIMRTQQKQPPPSPLSFETDHLSSAVDMPGQSSISNLLDVIMKSGLVSNNPADINNCSILPPVPSETLPNQVLTSSVATSSYSSGVPTSCSFQMPTLLKTTRALLPPLPPGPPPSSLGGTPSQISSKPGGAISSVLSSLWWSLVDKSFKSSSITEDLTPAESPHQLPHQSSGFAGSMAMFRPSTSANISDTSSPLVKEHFVPEASAPVSATITQSTATESRDFIGIDFKPETMSEHHSFVINALFDDLKHQCKTCGLRFKLPEKLRCHLDWHASKRLELSNIARRSRKWFTNLSCWLDGIVRPSCVTVSVTSVEELVSDGEACELMVPADQSQVICALCGEPFEDFYSCERGEWMYRGAVHLNLPDRDSDDKSMGRILEQAVIVHAMCK